MKHKKLIAVSPLFVLVLIPFLLNYVSDGRFLAIIITLTLLVATGATIKLRGKIRIIPLILSLFIITTTCVVYLIAKNFMKEWQF